MASLTIAFEHKKLTGDRRDDTPDEQGRMSGHPASPGAVGAQVPDPRRGDLRGLGDLDKSESSPVDSGPQARPGPEGDSVGSWGHGPFLGAGQLPEWIHLDCLARLTRLVVDRQCFGWSVAAGHDRNVRPPGL